MRWARGHAAVVVVVLLLPPLLCADQIAEHPPLTVATIGVRVLLDATPLCKLSGDDVDGKMRANAFLNELRRKVGETLARLEFPLGFAEWKAELELESEPPNSISHVKRARVLESVPRLDQQLLRATYVPRLPALLNFRARCAVTIRVRELRPGE